MLRPERRPGSAGWGGGSITEAVFNDIRAILPEGKTILELGSGWGSGQLAKHYEVHSIEHAFQWTDMYHHNYIYAPLKEHKVQKNYPNSNHWYDTRVLRYAVPQVAYDLLLVDGPPRPDRSGLVKYWGIFHTTDVPLVFDDIQRPDDRQVMVSIATLLKKPCILYGAGEGKKMWGIINDPRLKL
jgi:hypothetical protein